MATIYSRKLKTGTYIYLNWKDKDGTRRRKPLGRKDELTTRQIKIAKHAKELELLGVATDATRRRKNFTRFAQDYLHIHSVRHAQSTHKRYKGIINNYLLQFFGVMDLQDITNNDVDLYIAWRKDVNKTPSPETINLEIKILVAIINAALGAGVIKHKKLKTLGDLQLPTATKKIRYFNEEELQTLYDNAEYPHYWRFLANSGLRLGEALRLKWADIKDDLMTVESTNVNRTKGRKFRDVPLFDGIKDALAEFDHDSEYVFPRMCVDHLSNLAKRDIKRAGLEGYCYMLRHTFGTLAARNGVDLRHLQKIMGHSKSIVTEQYVHVDLIRLLDRVNLKL